MALPIAQELTEFISIYNTIYASGTEKARGTKLTDAWARITEGGGSYEPTTQQHEEQVQSFEIVIQHVDGVKAWMEIAWGSRTLDITEPPQKIFDRNNRPWWIIQATETTERDIRT